MKCCICRKEGVGFDDRFWRGVNFKAWSNHIDIQFDNTLMHKDNICKDCLQDIFKKGTLVKIVSNPDFQKDFLKMVRKWWIAGRI